MGQLTKFNKGDLIECDSTSIARVGIGERFLVVDVRPRVSAPSFHPELVYIEVDGIVRSYSPRHFKLVSTAQEVKMSRSEIIDKTKKDPPEYKEGDKVRIVGNSGNHHINICSIVTLKKRYSNSHGWWKSEEDPSMWIPEEDIELVSESIDLSAKADYTINNSGLYLSLAKVQEQLVNEIRKEFEKVKSNINQQEEVKMNVIKSGVRRVVNVKLVDDDQGLPVEFSLVGEWSGIVTEDDDSTTVQQLILDEDVAQVLSLHNDNRQEQTDLDILSRTGNVVTLRPVKLKQLRWVVTQA